MTYRHPAFALLAGVLFVATTAPAQFTLPDPVLSEVSISAEAVGASVLVDPERQGTRFDEAFAAGGGRVDATVMIQLVDTDGNVMAGFPREDIWLETTDGGLVACPITGTHPDQSTDEQGRSYWRNPERAGGCSVGEHVVAYVNGVQILSWLEIVFRSPDLNGDFVVNLPDIVMFTQMLSTQAECGDLNNDDQVDLSDIVYMAGAIGADCR